MSPRGRGHDVICPGCRESYHETTASYYPEKDANAGMLELKDIYKSYGWDEPVRDPTAGYGILICPDCEAPLAPSGRLEVRLKETPPGPVEGKEPEPELPEDEVQQSDTVLICPKCQTPVIAAEGDKVAICPNHGEIPLQELLSTEASTDMSSGSFNMGSVIKAAQEAGKKEDKAFKCPHNPHDCDKGPFKTKANLGSHMRTHKK